VSAVSSRKDNPEGAGRTFEQAVAEVEAIIERIESGEIGLEEQIEQYARGAELLKRCRTILDRCEQRVEEITAELAKADGAKGDAGSNG
jgi:exodeoxyribonuclease VII small subunit